MKALTWQGKGKITCESVPDPRIEHDRDVIIKVTACAICGSDLHLMGGFMPTMECGDVLGHETMGEVIEVGKAASRLKIGDRIVVPFTICCGECRQCKWGNWSCCERTNPNGKMQAETFGYPLAGLFGFSHITGGFAGGQAEYLRVPYADVGPIVVPDGVSDEQALFLSDIFPTAFPGGGALRHRSRGHDRRLGLRASRGAGDQVMLPARREAGDRHRHGARASRVGAGGGRRDHRLRPSRRFRRHSWR